MIFMSSCCLLPVLLLLEPALHLLDVLLFHLLQLGHVQRLDLVTLDILVGFFLGSIWWVDTQQRCFAALAWSCEKGNGKVRVAWAVPCRWMRVLSTAGMLPG